MGLSILLVTGACVLMGHVWRLRNQDLGFQKDHVLLVQLDPSRSGFRRKQLGAPYQDLLRRLETIPSVRSASIAGCTPIQGCGASRFVTAEGYAERPEDRRFTALSWVAPKYFDALGIPLLAGRDFRFSDAGRGRVAIVSEAMARHYFAGVDPIGKHLTIDRNPQTGGWYGSDEPYEIIGVAGDTKYAELREPAPRTLYLNMFQEDRLQHQLVLRTNGEPTALAGDVRDVARDILKTVTVTRVTTLSDQVDAALVPERLMATLSGAFGAIAATLAGIGLYGLLAYTVARRVNEIGVRMALGATAGQVAGMVLTEALVLVAAGLAVGVPMVIWSRSLLTHLVEDLDPANAWPLIFSILGVVGIATLACWIPARRAARVDPMEALRHD